MTHRKNMGLRAIAAAERAPSEKLAAANFSETVIELPPSDIDHNAGIRDRFSEFPEGFDTLMASIRENGQQQPILVGLRDPQTGKYPIIAGRTRLRIASQLGIKLKAIVRPIEGEARLVAQLQENLARADYTVGDKIGIMIELKNLSFKQTRIAETMSISPTDVSKLLGIFANLTDLAKTEEFPKALLSSKAGRPKWESLVKALQELPDNSQNKNCQKIIDQLQRECDADPISLALISTKKAIRDHLSTTTYRPHKISYESAIDALLNATFNTRNLCKLRYDGDPNVKAMLQEAAHLNHEILRAMIIERFEVLRTEVLNSEKTSDRGIQ
ncbi:ParB family chromosome partitioning protein [Sulfitobacter undariae]|uniref:ParB family chromosome partitioning protein n=1 Tax=Sulfitobacter undariae TaxID=1563671 RepID=A0A7W6E6A3_9RHOB|nr:ParB/RepB/Spo0J family partition protein [Sulfitobacter undariae]MBB3995541.1 ParB family chromosome partitioning protein [Sulfitobacter undariae]